jgi:hypothetical protein
VATEIVALPTLQCRGLLAHNRLIDEARYATSRLGEAVSDVFTMAFMLTGRLLAESLRVGAGLEVADLRLVRSVRHGVSNSTTRSEAPILLAPGRRAVAGHPRIWTFRGIQTPGYDKETNTERSVATIREVFALSCSARCGLLRH